MICIESRYKAKRKGVGCFKNNNFFADSINSICKINFTVTNIFIPIGISYYTFIQLAYLIDIYKEQKVRTVRTQGGCPKTYEYFDKMKNPFGHIMDIYIVSAD